MVEPRPNNGQTEDQMLTSEMATNTTTSAGTVSSQSQLSTVLETLSEQLNGQGEVHLNIGEHLETQQQQQQQRQQPQQPDAHAQTLALICQHLSKFGIFVLILLLKILYTHRYGLLVIIAAGVTWHYGNSILTSQITLRNHVRYKQHLMKLAWVTLFTSIALFNIYYWFDDKNILSGRLWLSNEGLTDGEEIDFWKLLWILVLTDFAVKYTTIIVKCLISITPKALIAHQRKSSLYSFIERTTLLYRSLLPIIPWYYFLLGTSDGLWFSVCLFITYVVFKFLNMVNQLNPLKKSFFRVFSNNQYGTTPTASELTEAGDNCPVCHDSYSSPIMLTCRHIFCEDCVLVWFDREKSCPMCRAVIVNEDCTYRDGAGTEMIQFF